MSNNEPMKSIMQVSAIVLVLMLSIWTGTAAQSTQAGQESRIIEFPDIPGYKTLKCDLHMHTVFSDGNVWPAIRVQEAKMDGLDAISITDHLEYQPHGKDVPQTDRNRPYQLAQQAAKGSDLMIINGAEITRSMPPGHFNAIFVKDANALNQEDVMEVFREAKQQGAFVFWNHPHWTSQKPDGVALLTEMHLQLLEEGLFAGIEIYNESTYSDEALEIAGSHDLTILGNSDIHSLIDWEHNIPGGGHRPVTLAFAEERTIGSLREAFEAHRTVVWFDNTLVGDSEYLIPLVENSLEVSRQPGKLVEHILIENRSDADYIVENHSDFNLHDHARVFVLKANETTMVQVKTLEKLDAFELRLRVLNAFTAPDQHPMITLRIL
jgi:hypothetical protein